jgi:hypothetical protein
LLGADRLKKKFSVGSTMVSLVIGTRTVLGV